MPLAAKGPGRLASPPSGGNGLPPRLPAQALSVGGCPGTPGACGAPAVRARAPSRRRDAWGRGVWRWDGAGLAISAPRPPGEDGAWLCVPPSRLPIGLRAPTAAAPRWCGGGGSARFGRRPGGGSGAWGAGARSASTPDGLWPGPGIRGGGRSSAGSSWRSPPSGRLRDVWGWRPPRRFGGDTAPCRPWRTTGSGSAGGDWDRRLSRGRRLHQVRGPGRGPGRRRARGGRRAGWGWPWWPSRCPWRGGGGGRRSRGDTSASSWQWMGPGAWPSTGTCPARSWGRPGLPCPSGTGSGAIGRGPGSRWSRRTRYHRRAGSWTGGVHREARSHGWGGASIAGRRWPGNSG